MNKMPTKGVNITRLNRTEKVLELPLARWLTIRQIVAEFGEGDTYKTARAAYNDILTSAVSLGYYERVRDGREYSYRRIGGGDKTKLYAGVDSLISKRNRRNKSQHARPISIEKIPSNGPTRPLNPSDVALENVALRGDNLGLRYQVQELQKLIDNLVS